MNTVSLRGQAVDYPSPTDVVDDGDFDEMLYARHAELKSFEDLEKQRGTPIPALFNSFYKFIQNPSTVGVETYKRMVDTDDTIGSGVDFLTTCLAARLGRYTHPSKEITEWMNKALGVIDGGFTTMVKEMLAAVWAGFAVGEKVWMNDDLGFVIKKLVTLPPGTLLFETERTGELTPDGILQYQRNYNPANLAFGSGSLFGFAGGAIGRNDPYAKFGDFSFPIRTANTYSYLSVRIPVQKCVHYAFDAQGRFGNPYGRSLLRRAYKWYVMKDAFLQMLSVALDRKGTPLTIVYADPNATLLDPTKVTPGHNLKGQVAGIRADAAAAQAFRNIHNDSTIILPGRKGQVFDTDFVPQAANAADFIAAIDLCNKSILRALLVPSLIFGNGDGTGSYSLGQEHAKTFDKICDGMLSGLKETLRHQAVKDLLAYNFPASAWKRDGLGDFTKVEMSQDEIKKETEVLGQAINDGAVDMNDLNDLNKYRDKIGFDPRTEIIQKPMLGPDDLGAIGGGSGDQQDDDEEADDQQQGRGAPPPPPPKGGGDAKAGKRRLAAGRRRIATLAVQCGDHLLMGVRRDNGLWTVPGGHADAGEDFVSAALRELEEETGIYTEVSPEILTAVETVGSHGGERIMVQAFRVPFAQRPTTTMTEDPDGEVQRWQWINVKHGLPPDIAAALHVPVERNVLMKALGLAPAA